MREWIIENGECRHCEEAACCLPVALPPMVTMLPKITRRQRSNPDEIAS
ncbi:MAG: hypothetical protein LBT00_00875 [Spirochaetaceae bacterium]|nr:hypothetical protein [Spirochaetaceae bacterium]